ncbi:MAG: alcohol dehydrogenase catalytic domain-containing protein, partial [Sedimentisphaerales bacterium]|nr:alcohol dehydrogenase catalytic domain-containing protein [Sedimentisphaerales bacterium]
GVCGSDVHYYEMGRIGSQTVTYPYFVGHECSATVAAVGKAVKHLKVGQPVAVEPAMPCHTCDQCKAGRENTCRDMGFLGTPPQPGCLCEYIVMPEECVYPTHDKLTLEQAAVCEPLSIGVYSVQQACLPKHADIAILGSGPIGLSVLLAAKAQGARSIYVTEKIKERLQAAQKAGATWVGNPDSEDVVKAINAKVPLGVDAYFECAGKQETIDQGLEMLKPGGKSVLVGIPRVDRISFGMDNLRRREVTVVNIRRQNKCMQPAIDLVMSKKVTIDFMITHRVKLEQTKKAFDLLTDYCDGVIKALIVF